MAKSALEAMLPEPEHFVYFALGLISLGRRVERDLLEPVDEADAAGAEDALVFAALGALALRRGLESWVARACAPESSSRPHPWPDGLLR